MHKKVLAISNSPIKTYQYLAFPLAVVLQKDEPFFWFYNNYVQLYAAYLEDGRSPGINFFINGRNNLTPCEIDEYVSFCPYLEQKVLPRNDMTSEDILKFIISLIDNDYYVCLYVDKYYIPGTPFCNTTHFSHDILIYGYDHEENIMKILCYGASGHLSRIDVSFENLKTGIMNGDNDVFLYRYKNADYSFDVGMFKTFLKDYIFSNNTEIRLLNNFKKRRNYVLAHKGSYIWGLEVYKYLKTYIYISINNGHPLDLKNFTCMEEHKHCMVDRLSFLHKNSIIKKKSYLKRAKNIFNKSTLLKCLAIKYNVLLENKKSALPIDSTIVCKIIAIIDCLFMKDLALYGDLLSYDYKTDAVQNG